MKTEKMKIDAKYGNKQAFLCTSQKIGSGQKMQSDLERRRASYPGRSCFNHPAPPMPVAPTSLAS